MYTCIFIVSCSSLSCKFLSAFFWCQVLNSFSLGDLFQAIFIVHHILPTSSHSLPWKWCSTNHEAVSTSDLLYNSKSTLIILIAVIIMSWIHWYDVCYLHVLDKIVFFSWGFLKDRQLVYLLAFRTGSPSPTWVLGIISFKRDGKVSYQNPARTHQVR